jgi:hypothetical protein
MTPLKEVEGPSALEIIAIVKLEKDCASVRSDSSQ